MDKENVVIVLLLVLVCEVFLFGMYPFIRDYTSPKFFNEPLSSKEVYNDLIKNGCEIYKTNVPTDEYYSTDVKISFEIDDVYTISFVYVNKYSVFMRVSSNRIVMFAQGFTDNGEFFTERVYLTSFGDSGIIRTNFIFEDKSSAIPFEDWVKERTVSVK